MKCFQNLGSKGLFLSIMRLRPLQRRKHLACLMLIKLAYCLLYSRSDQIASAGADSEPIEASQVLFRSKPAFRICVLQHISSKVGRIQMSSDLQVRRRITVLYRLLVSRCVERESLTQTALMCWRRKCNQDYPHHNQGMQAMTRDWRTFTVPGGQGETK
jgi:hypothetical protein